LISGYSVVFNRFLPSDVPRARVESRAQKTVHRALFLVQGCVTAKGGVAGPDLIHS
jgi:hypothetical protein